MDQDRIMKVTDDQGHEIEMYILFTTTLEEFNKNYIFYTNPKDEEGQVFVSSYTEDNKLQQVDNPAEWEALEEIFNEFIKEAQEAKGCEGCNGECDENCDESCSSCNKQN